MEAQAGRALLLLHELGHTLGILETPDAGPELALTNRANTLRVLQNCFTRDAAGVWR